MQVGLLAIRSASLAALTIGLILALGVPAQAKVKPRSLTDSQAAILDRGFKVKVANTGREARRVWVKVKGSSFDEPDWAKLVRTKRVRLAPHSKRRLRLKLNARGREAVASCAGRDLRVRVGGNARVRDLVRDTAGCAPKPVDLTPRRRVRLRRPAAGLAVPAALPRRLLHGRGRDHPHRPPGGPEDAGDARQHRRRARRGRPVQPQRRVQPRAVDRAQGARPGHARGACGHRPGGAQPPRPLLRARRAGGRDRRRDRRALADLGRDRLERDEPPRRRR